jgi:hypothetical protein
MINSLLINTIIIKNKYILNCFKIDTKYNEKYENFQVFSEAGFHIEVFWFAKECNWQVDVATRMNMLPPHFSFYVTRSGTDLKVDTVRYSKTLASTSQDKCCHNGEG